jgi:hypothetical protein
MRHGLHSTLARSHARPAARLAQPSASLLMFSASRARAVLFACW